jgi:hypothetical protein
LGWFFFTGTGKVAAFGAGIFIDGLAVPILIHKVMRGIDKVIEGEVVFAVKEASATADDLFELE